MVLLELLPPPTLDTAAKTEVVREVTEMYYVDEGGGAPVMQYEWRGKKHSYASRTYSSPPEYEVGQIISLYVNREEPDEISSTRFRNGMP
jgi:hypothetical protein